MAQRSYLSSSSDALYSAAVKEFANVAQYDSLMRCYLFAGFAEGFASLLAPSSASKSTAASTGQTQLHLNLNSTADQGAYYVAHKFPLLLKYAADMLYDTPIYSTLLFSRAKDCPAKLLKQVIEWSVPNSPDDWLESFTEGAFSPNAIYAYLNRKTPLLPPGVINELVIPRALGAQAKGFVKQERYAQLKAKLKTFFEWVDGSKVLNRWSVQRELKTNKDVEKFLQESVFNTKDTVDIVVAAETIAGEVNYFFGSAGEKKVFGDYVLTVESVHYHPSNDAERSMRNSHITLNESNANMGRYVRFKLSAENAQHEVKTIHVHFFKVSANDPMTFDVKHDFHQFSEKLADPSLKSSVLVQGSAGIQLMLMAVFADHWEYFAAESFQEVAKKCLEFYCFLKQLHPSYQLTQDQFVAAVTGAARLAASSPTKLFRSSSSVATSHAEEKTSSAEMSGAASTSSSASSKTESPKTFTAVGSHVHHTYFSSPLKKTERLQARVPFSPPVLRRSPFP